MKRPLEESKGTLGSVGGVPWRVNDDGRGNEDPIGFICSIVQLFFCLLSSSFLPLLFCLSFLPLFSSSLFFLSFLFLFSLFFLSFQLCIDPKMRNSC